MRIKEQETRLTLNEHDDDDDDNNSIKTVKDTKNFIVTQEMIYKIVFVIMF
jgi:hypothetical protein